MTLPISILQFSCLDFNQNGLSLTAHLAFKGRDDAVNTVITMLQGKPEDAAYGYVLAGEFDKANTLLTDAASEQVEEAIKKKMVRGAARANQLDALDTFISNRTDYLADEVRGLAEGGNRDQLAPLVNRNPLLFTDAVQGYATTEQKETLMDLIRGTSLLNHAIFHAAQAGHEGLVNELLESSGITPDPTTRNFFSEQDKINYTGLLNHAVKGYTRGCHFNQACALMDAGVSSMQCASELPSSIMVDIIKTLTETVDFEVLETFVSEHSQSDTHHPS
ncbi:MAG: hypothetical protein K0U37_05985 [Gammaproteobacteria bacterium]|nr:hypothetical protein [Gammaproteobacteria bacterium]